MVFPGYNPQQQPGYGFPQPGYTLRQRRPPRPRRLGLFRILFLLIFFVIVVVFLDGLLAPWAFVMGGHRHLLPSWQGWARMHAPASGGDYYLYIRMAPAPSRHSRSNSLKGDGYLCTPRNERFHLLLSGSMPRNLPADLTGQPITLSLHHRPLFYGFGSSGGDTLRLQLRGAWIQNGLSADDNGSLARAFLPDGTRRPASPRNSAILTSATQVVRTSFQEAPYFVWQPACPPALPTP